MFGLLLCITYFHSKKQTKSVCKPLEIPKEGFGIFIMLLPHEETFVYKG